MELISSINAAQKIASSSATPPVNPKNDWSQILQKTLARIPEAPAAPTGAIPKEVQKLFEYQKKVATWQLNVELVTRVVDAGLGLARKLQQGNL